MSFPSIPSSSFGRCASSWFRWQGTSGEKTKDGEKVHLAILPRKLKKCEGSLLIGHWRVRRPHDRVRVQMSTGGDGPNVTHLGGPSRLLKKAVCRLVKKISEARLRRQLSRAAREKSTRVGVLRRYVGATPLGVGMIPAAIERHYPKRLLKAGWWHMSLFQQPGRQK